METGFKATSDALAAAFLHYTRMVEHVRLEIEAPMRALRTIAGPLQEIAEACRHVVGRWPVCSLGERGDTRP